MESYLDSHLIGIRNERAETAEEGQRTDVQVTLRPFVFLPPKLRRRAHRAHDIGPADHDDDVPSIELRHHDAIEDASSTPPRHPFPRSRRLVLSPSPREASAPPFL